MSLSPQWLDELRSRITLSSVVQRTTRLTKAGREFKACCPFHNEKSPSFYVNDEKGFYHCFGCGVHGDAIRWMTDQRGLGFMDAVKELAAEAGLDVPAPDLQAAKQAEQRDSLHDVMAAAQKWFVESLDSAEGAKARAYLATRGFDAHTRQRFGFGYAPEGRQALRGALTQFPEGKLIEAGLRIAVDDKEPYDRFRGRLMLPIEDARGRVIAFGGRILDKDKKDAPKYLNSPDTPLFDKGRTLYNLHRAIPAARQSGRLIAVEGYMDVIALAAAGIDEGVAPLGTALTEQQIEILWRHVETPLLCFDGDSAGKRAATRAATRALPILRPGHSLKIVQLPAGKDPDDIIKQSGVAAMEMFLDESFTLLEYLWLQERNAKPVETPEEKAGLKERLLNHVDTITDPVIRSLYRADLLEEFSKFAYSKKEREAKNKIESYDSDSRDLLKSIYCTDISESAKYFHKRLGAAIARSFVLWPDQLMAYSDELATVRDLDARIDVMIDAVDGRAIDIPDLQLAIHEHGLPQPHPNEFGNLRFPFAWPFADPQRAKQTLEKAIIHYVRLRNAREELELAQQRYERDFDLDSEREKNRLLWVVDKLLKDGTVMEQEFECAA